MSTMRHGLPRPRIPVWGMLAVVLLSAGPAAALVNLSFTPADLYHGATAIAKLQLSAPDADGKLAVRNVKAMKGDSPGSLAIEVNTDDDLLLRDVTAAFGEAKHAEALVFHGDFSGAVDADAMTDRQAPKAMLNVAGTWFGLYDRAGGALQIGSDPFDLKTVWAGATDMLARCLRYIASDPRAEVPVRSGAAWRAAKGAGQLTGRASDILPIRLDDTGRPWLLVVSRSGDRLYRVGADGVPVDATAERKLDSKSSVATWGDFTGDGRLDLASATDAALTVYAQQPDGSFAASGSAAFDAAVEGLAAMPAGDESTGILVSTSAGLRLARVEGGSVTAEAIAPAAGEGAAGPCAVADFTGDGLPDVFQPAPDGGWLYEAGPDGTFAPPRQVSEANFGEGVTDVFCGDFEANGRLDVVVTGRRGVWLLVNGASGWSERLYEAGEVSYNARPGIVGGSTCEINNDGRQDFVLLYAMAAPQMFFNRGFRCFGYAVDLEESLRNVDRELSDALMRGQQAGTVVDLDGDGGQDLAAVTADGQLVVLLRGEAPSTLGLTVQGPATQEGPATVWASDGKRPLGARVLRPGQAVLLGKSSKGPLKLGWQRPGEAKRNKRAVVLRAQEMTLPESE
ncbi:MAG: FG-GAP repeat domain-containing protein [Planctomycetota bacterium]